MSTAHRVTIVDTGLSNIWSVLNAFEFLGARVDVCSDASSLASADVLVLPGVGSYRQAMARLTETRIDEAIRECAENNARKILGICLGMQLLATTSTEDGVTSGLGIIPANVEAFTSSEVLGSKIPHIGFNSVRPPRNSILFAGLSGNPDFYFVHSYRVLPAGLPDSIALCNYGIDFAATYEHKNIYATQFHPEKSQANGLHLLKNFLEA